MINISIGNSEYEVSSENGRWRCCDLENGFLVLVSDVIDKSYIEKVLEDSVFESHQYNTVFKSQLNRSWCIRFFIDKNKESDVQSILENFNV